MTIILAMVLDAIFGEPKAIWTRFPHPAILMGRCVSFVDRTLNHGPMRRDMGIAGMAGLVVAFALMGYLLEQFIGWPAQVLVGAILLAQKSLVDHVRAVSQGLRQSLADGRFAVSMIVGRDTDAMDQPAVARAAIESAAENFSDGVIAPLFWFLVGGLPGLMVYKITNTADSMIGYKTEKYREFGWAAARFDDLLNLIPARLTALLFILPYPRLWQFKPIYADAIKHRSPNAGWPEAALSRVLNVALSGPRPYHGHMQDYDWVNDGARDALTADDIDAAIVQLWRAWSIALVMILLIAFICG